MGWSSESLTISFTLDSHGGEKEDRHYELYQAFLRDLHKLCWSGDYSEIVNEWSIPGVYDDAART